MCVAVLVPAGKRLTEQQLRAMHSANPDSWGFAFFVKHAEGVTSVSPGYIKSNKAISGSDDMVAAYNRAWEERNTDGNGPSHAHMVHFRIATCGKKDIANAHPFYIANGMLIHNGHFSGAGNDEHSDTNQFASAFYSHLKPGMTEEQKDFLGNLIGGYNKLVMLHSDGSYTIINEKRGTVLDNGIWVSNTFWEHGQGYIPF